MVSNDAKRNLIVQTAFLGDLLLSIPLIRAVRARYPGHELHLVCRPGFGELFLRSGLVDEVHEVRKGSSESYSLLRQELGKFKFDFVFSPHESIRTARLVSSLSASKKVGFRHWWNFWAFNCRLNRPMHLPDALRQLSLLRSVDPGFSNQIEAEQVRFHNRAPLFQKVDLNEIPAWASMNLREKLGFSGRRFKRVFLAPGSQWATKRWSVEGYCKLAQKLSERGYEIHLVGSANESAICKSVAEGISGVVNHCGQTTLFQLTELLATGELLVANDSGVMHLGSVVDIPTVAIFGPTTLELGYRPWQNRALVVEKNLNCRPCGKHGHQVCPIGTHACMKNISAQNVLQTIEELVS